jgi:hypothetical protein
LILDPLLLPLAKQPIIFAFLSFFFQEKTAFPL